MTTENSRFRVIANTELPPAVDWITRTSVGPFIDTGVDIGRASIERGRLYLAVSTITEMAEVAGILHPADPMDVEIRIQQAFDLGRAQGIKENLGGRFNDLVDSLILVSDTLGAANGASYPDPESTGKTSDDVGSGEGSAPAGTAEGEGGSVDTGESTLEDAEGVNVRSDGRPSGSGADGPKSRGGSRRDQLPADLAHVEPISI